MLFNPRARTVISALRPLTLGVILLGILTNRSAASTATGDFLDLSAESSVITYTAPAAPHNQGTFDLGTWAIRSANPGAIISASRDGSSVVGELFFTVQYEGPGVTSVVVSGKLKATAYAGENARATGYCAFDLAEVEAEAGSEAGPSSVDEEIVLKTVFLDSSQRYTGTVLYAVSAYEPDEA